MTDLPVSLFNVKLHLPADLDDVRIGSIAAGLEHLALATTMGRDDNDHRGAWTITWIMDGEPDEAVLRNQLHAWTDITVKDGDLTIEPVPDVNWLAHSYKQFEPFTVDDFFIYGSHHEDDVPDALIPLQIDAATAFGSGSHGTTAGCLRCLLALKAQGAAFENILDMGTGSGILAVAAARLWPADANMAVDIEEEAVRVTDVHAAMNGVADKIAAFHGDGFATPEVQQKKPFDLVIANILAGPLISMAPDLVAVTETGGHIILSGMLDEQTPDVLAAYEARGCTQVTRFDEKGWVALLLRKS